MRLRQFTLDKEVLDVQFVEALDVVSGVVCYVHEFVGDGTRDLAIVEVGAGHKTPKQRVIGGTKTIEGFVSGEGTLTVTGVDGELSRYDYPSCGVPSIFVGVGEIMQWAAGANLGLIFFEVCTPPYDDGRFEDLY